MSSPPTPEEFDQATVDLIFALRDSLTDEGPSLLDFWTGGRAVTAIRTAAAVSSTGNQAVSKAAERLQIPQYAFPQSQTIVQVAAMIDRDYAAWSRHVDQGMPYILALADIDRQERRRKREENA